MAGRLQVYADLEANLAAEFADVANQYDTKGPISVNSQSLFCVLCVLLQLFLIQSIGAWKTGRPFTYHLSLFTAPLCVRFSVFSLRVGVAGTSLMGYECALGLRAPTRPACLSSS